MSYTSLMKPSASKRTPKVDVERVRRIDHYFEAIQACHAGRTPEFDAVAMAAWFGMVQTFVVMESRMSARVQAQGLTLPGMNVLGILRLHEPQGIPLNELSRYLTVTRANITGLIDHLVRKGLVKRVNHATDRRSRLAQLTSKGKAWLESFLPGHFKAIKHMLSPLSSHEKVTLTHLLSKMRHSLLNETLKP